jgi:hypothetical protein
MFFFFINIYLLIGKYKYTHTLTLGEKRKRMVHIGIRFIIDRTGFYLYDDDLLVRTATLLICYNNQTFLRVNKPSGDICYSGFVTAEHYQSVLGMDGKTVAEFDAQLELLPQEQ